MRAVRILHTLHTQYVRTDAFTCVCVNTCEQKGFASHTPKMKTASAYLLQIRLPGAPLILKPRV